MLNLDFSLPTIEERKTFIDHYFTRIDPSTLPAKDLETIANYLLYGKDEDGTSIVSRKEIDIDTRYNTFKRKAPDSLDELLENPNFDEHHLRAPYCRNYYRTPKPSIDRSRDSYIPGITELWDRIDHWQHLLDVAQGKTVDPAARPLSPLEQYKVRHLIAELRKEQFTLKDGVTPTILREKTNIHPSFAPADPEITWDLPQGSFAIAPLGVFEPSLFLHPSNPFLPDRPPTRATTIIDLRDKLHIYYLLEHYEDLAIGATNSPDSTMGELLSTLDWYIARTPLTEPQLAILHLKKKGAPNLAIAAYLRDTFSLSYSINYISTVWKQKICGKIADTVTLHYDYYLNRKDPTKWKKCNQCGRIKLLDSREFMRKGRSADGYSNRCKECDKLNRTTQKSGGNTK